MRRSLKRSSLAGATSVPPCSGWDTNQEDMGLRVASVFIILVSSLLGVLLPMALARAARSADAQNNDSKQDDSRRQGPNHRLRRQLSKQAFFVAKYFGTGVILATAFIHLLSPANTELNDPCLADTLPDYDWAQGIALMTVVAMFFVELMAARFDFGFGHAHGHGHSGDPSSDLLGSHGQLRDIETKADGADSSGGTSLTGVAGSGIPLTATNLPDGVGYPPGNRDHLGHHRDHVEGDSHSGYASQLTALLILEFGVVFHSLFIGLSLAGTGELTILLIVISFHQFFEGLGLGSRLATANWPQDWKAWTPMAMALGYSITTPLGIAIGLGVKQSLADNAARSQLVNGVFDATSGGILLYTALVELLAHEFMFNPEMRKASLRIQMLAFGCVAAGAGLMALLGKWA